MITYLTSLDVKKRIGLPELFATLGFLHVPEANDHIVWTKQMKAGLNHVKV